MQLTDELGFYEFKKTVKKASIESLIAKLELHTMSTVELVGGLSQLAYISNEYQYLHSIKENFKVYQNIYRELDEFPLLFSNMDEIDYGVIQTLIKKEFELSILNDVAGFNTSKFKALKRCYGVQYLFILLLELDSKNFEEWIINTQRKDFKVIFIQLFNNRMLSEYCDPKLYDLSNIGVVQAFYVKFYYGIGGHSYNICNERLLDIHTLFSSSLSNRVKFLVCVKYVTQKYHGKKLEDFQSDKELKSLVYDMLKLKYSFDMDELIGTMGIYNSALCYYVIYLIDTENSNRAILLNGLQNRLLKYLTSVEYYSSFDIKHANILGMVTKELGTSTKIEELYSKNYKELSFPYSFCRMKDWQKRMTHTLYLLIGLYVYKAHNKLEYNSDVKKFLFLNRSVQYINEDLDEIMSQISDTI